MKKKLPGNLERFAIEHPMYVSRPAGSIEGFFIIPYAGEHLAVISGCGEGWDHVSVSLKHRTPTWDEMKWIKDRFFEPDELVIQFHPPAKDYINVASNALHLWRPWHQDIRLPPKWMMA